MSRREDRDSDSRRHRSGLDHESSPKRSRRDGKPQTERLVSNADVGDKPDQDEKQRRRLQDALPLEGAAPPAPDSSKIEIKESDRKNSETNKHSSHPTEVPRSRSFFQQHDEHGSAAHAGRSYSRRAASEREERGWWRDAKDHRNQRETKTYETKQRDEKPKAKGDGKDNWRHDRFFEMEAADPATQPPSTRKRPAFSEKKIPAATQSIEHAAKESEKANHSGRHALGSERRDRDRNPRHLDRLSARDQISSRREAPRGGFLSHDRHGGGGGGDNSFRGRDRFSGRPGYRSGGTRVDKWKHDLFDEANKSPPRKNEEDQIAKVESLLAS